MKRHKTFHQVKQDLYDDIFNIFLEEWAEERGVHRNPPMGRYLAIPTVKELLSEIAAVNFKANRLVFSKDELVNQIQDFYQQKTDIYSRFDASKILGSILVDPGLFVEQAKGIYSFFHLTFQEYLTANHFVKTQSIQNLVSNHLHDDRYIKVFLFTAGIMHTADDLLVAMEGETSKTVNIPTLKVLTEWTKQITDASGSHYSGVAARAFAFRQYFFLRILNKIHETVKDWSRQTRDIRLCCAYDFSLDSYFYKDLELYEELYPFLYLDCYENLYQNLNLDLDLYKDLYRDLDLPPLPRVLP